MRALTAAALLFSVTTATAQAPATGSCHPTLAPRAAGPQVADTTYDPPVPSPAFQPGQGPLVLLDEGHFNFHTREGRFAPFARLLRRDGFTVGSLRDPLTNANLAGAGILVIANALAERNARGGWSLPTPSAFAAGEIGTVQRWVADGGSLLLIADHMPFPGAAEALAGAFGVFLTNGFATDSTCGADELVFAASDGTLTEHPITSGRHHDERVDSVRTFTGQAFRLTGAALALLTLTPGSVVLLPSRAWAFSDSTPRIPAGGMAQGAVLRYGRGRVAIFGEAAMFTAQVSGPQRRPMGMNAPDAGQNFQFLLNLMHWLAGMLPAGR